jgi:mono/diheme cytochrome c family protein
MSIRMFLIVLAGSLTVTACGQQGATGPSAMELLEGEAIYKAECAMCHGANLEGQANWRERRPDGKLPAPPHDASGHTWHHAMEQLVSITKLGLVPPNAPEGYLSDMPGYAAKLSDAQIRNVLSYIESQWPQEIRDKRAERFGPGTK